MASGYIFYFREQYGELIDRLDLHEMQKRFLTARWLDLVLWHEAKAARANSMYHGLRITTLVGGATATAFASLKLSGAASRWVSVLIFVLTLTTTIAAGLEELMRYGQERTTHRAIAERMKQEGWFFFQLVGSYRQYRSHGDAFKHFSEAVELEAAQEPSRRHSVLAPAEG